MSHALYPLPLGGQRNQQNAKTLNLLRRDKEQSLEQGEANGQVMDWSDLLRVPDTLLLGTLAVGYRSCRRRGPPAILDVSLDRQRADLVQRSVALFAGYENIVSSRLHGALLGLLLQKRVRMLGNLTGKSRAYYETWLSDHPDCDYDATGEKPDCGD